MNIELPYIIHMVLDWGNLYIVGFASTKATYMQTCKKIGHKSWKNSEANFLFLEIN
jgi:hypothetical protein